MKTFAWLMLFLPLFATGQSVEFQNITPTSSLGTEYSLIVDQTSILVYACKTDCNRPEDGIFQEMIQLKLVNTSEQNFVVSWDLVVWNDGQRWTRLPLRPENRKSVVLKGGETLSGSCDKSSDYYDALMIFSKFLNYIDKPVLTQFALTNLTISAYED